MNVNSVNMENFSTLCAGVSGAAVIYLLHSLYTSHVLFTTNSVFDSRRALPASVYLTGRYMYQCLRKPRGKHRRKNTDSHHDLVLTLINCRYDVGSLSRFCSVVGYGRDYPDSVFRDIPLCYPEFLFRRLITMIVCSDRFRLSPLGLLSVRETLIVPEAVDELKRGPFSLQVRVMEYRAVSAGVEVDLSLTASRDQQSVWGSTVTLLSTKSTFRAEDLRPQTGTENTHNLSSLRSIQLAVPRTTGMRCAWLFGDLCPLPASLLRFTRPTAPPLWMFSRCMAEIEKHKGVEGVRAPLTVSVCYLNSLALPKQVTIRISENTDTSTTAFSLEDHRTRSLYISGLIKTHSNEEI